MSKQTNDLQHELDVAATRMRQIVDKAAEEKRGLTGDEETEWQNARESFESMEKLLEKRRYQESKQAEMDEIINRHIEAEGDAGIVDMKIGEARGDDSAKTHYTTRMLGQDIPTEYSRRGRHTEPKRLPMVFDAFIRNGAKILRPADLELLESRQQSTSGSAGGYMIPQGFSDQLEQSMLAYGGIRNVATVWSTDTGNAVPWPTVNDTSNTGALISENSEDTELDVTFGQITFNAYTYTSKVVRVSKELLQDSAFDVQALLVRLFAERLGRITATHYATGDGSSKPNGLATAAGAVAAAGNAAITYADILNLEHAVDPAYRDPSRCRFVMNDSTLKVLRQIKDDTGGSGSGRPLWQPQITDSVPATIDGYPYTIDQGIADIGSLAKSVVFGDISKYVIRDVRGFTLVVMNELYARYRQVGFNAFMRTDADLLDAGTDPVKALRHPT